MIFYLFKIAKIFFRLEFQLFILIIFDGEKLLLCDVYS